MSARLSTGLAASLVGGLLVALLTGCTQSDEPGEPEATAFQVADCPADVSGEILAEVTCGYLTVPENRSEPGREIRLLVTRVQPPQGSEPAEPVFVAGTEIASVPTYSGVAQMAQRVGREVIIMDARGVGHSEPALECPELAVITRQTLAAPVEDPATRTAFHDGVAACHDRWTSEGVDLSAYNLSEMAADAEDLRKALAIETWNVGTLGTASRIAVEMLRAAPDHIRSVVLDSPELPGDDPRSVAVTATRAAVREVLAACADDQACAAAFPDVQTLFQRALAVVDAQPVTVEYSLAADPVPVLVDAAMLVRVVRYILSDGGSSGDLFLPKALPRFLDDVASGRLKSLQPQLQRAFEGDTPYCAGYVPKCLPHHRRSIGVAFSVLCHDIAPFTDLTEPARLTEGDVGFETAYGASPYLDVCEHWPVGEAAPETWAPVSTDVPVLAMVGGFSAFTPEDRVRAGLSSFSELAVVIDTYGEHNVTGRTDCTLGIRLNWLDEPTRTPDVSCLEDDSIAWALPSV